MKFRKKPVVIEAVQWDGTAAGYEKLCAFATGVLLDPQGIGGRLGIPTLEGLMMANVGDWIIRGVKGEFYPCKPDIFEATYEALPPTLEVDAFFTNDAVVEQVRRGQEELNALGASVVRSYVEQQQSEIAALKAALAEACELAWAIDRGRDSIGTGDRLRELRKLAEDA